MLELTARVLISRSDQMRGIIRDKDSEFRVYYLKEMARQITDAIMRTPGAVEISEYMNPATGSVEMRGRVFVADMEEKTRDRMMSVGGRRYGKSTYAMLERSNMMDAMRYSVGSPFNFNAERDLPKAEASTLTLDSIKKVMEQMEAYNPSPVEFLQQRVNRKKGIDEALESSKARVRADNTIRQSTKSPGEALPVVTVKVRKIQMPDQERIPEE